VSKKAGTRKALISPANLLGDIRSLIQQARERSEDCRIIDSTIELGLSLTITNQKIYVRPANAGIQM